MSRPADLRVAWLMPSMARALYWHPIFSEFAKLFPSAIFYTGVWPGFLAGFEDSFRVEVVGRTRYTPYGNGLTLPSPKILLHLLRFRPRVILTSGFSLWSIGALALKRLLGWRVIIVYAGSSTAADVLSSRARIFIRRLMTRCSDAIITNSQKGKQYLTGALRAEGSRVFARPIEVPYAGALSAAPRGGAIRFTDRGGPVFIVISRLVWDKGLHLLLEACAKLQAMEVDAFSLIVVGEGPQRKDLEALAVALGLKKRVQWTGWVEYTHLGGFMAQADVLVFPTLVDTWGMVVLEAMAFGKAILCSKWAGAAEMVADGENGFLFDPRRPDDLSGLMRRFVSKPGLAAEMGANSRSRIESHNPRNAAGYLGGIVRKQA